TSHLLARPIVNVPAAGSGTTCSAAPSITSSTRSPNGAWRSICSVVAPVSSSITWVAYAEPAASRNPSTHPAGPRLRNAGTSRNLARQRLPLLQRELVAILGRGQPLAVDRADAAVPPQDRVGIARRAQRLGALVPLHRMPEPIVGRRPDDVL